MGWKQFTRETLGSDEVQSYLMDQAVLRFESASARDAAVGSPGHGMVCYLEDTDALLTYDDTAWRYPNERRTGQPWAPFPMGTLARAAVTAQSALPVTATRLAALELGPVWVPAGRRIRLKLTGNVFVTEGGTQAFQLVTTLGGVSTTRRRAIIGTIPAVTTPIAGAEVDVEITAAGTYNAGVITYRNAGTAVINLVGDATGPDGPVVFTLDDLGAI